MAGLYLLVYRLFQREAQAIARGFSSLPTIGGMIGSSLMEKYSLGIFCFGSHDAAVAIIDSHGKILFAAEEERFDRKKHSSAFPSGALLAGFSQLKIQWKDVDRVAFAWNPFLNLGEVAKFLLGNLPSASRFLFSRKQKTDSRVKKWLQMVSIKYRLRKMGFRGRFQFLSHHLCHTASAFYASGFDAATCISVDGNGEFACTTISQAGDDGIKCLWEARYPNSLGLFYSSITQYLGFFPMNDEYKVMGLAGYGRESVPQALTNTFASILKIHEDGLYELDMKYFRFQNGEETMWSAELAAALGPCRQPGAEIEDRHRWIAAATQARLEAAMLGLAKKAYGLSDQKNLCLSGGVGLNCVANERLLREGPFERVFFQPASHDSGSALGAAYLALAAEDPAKRGLPINNYYLGNRFSENHLFEALRGRRFEKLDTVALTSFVAKALAEGKLAAWFEGSMEFGPRALGARSLLADPRRPESRERMNLVIKKRESFRPFAPVVCADKAERYFDLQGVASPFMMRTVPILPEFQAALVAVAHADGTARVQTLAAETNPLLYSLLEKFEALSGFPILMNTSLNRNFEPIVCRPEEALALFDDTEVDLLVMPPYVLLR